MDKPKRQKLKKDELDKVEFWANWREAGRAMGLMPSLKRHDEFGQYMENAIANFEAESFKDALKLKKEMKYKFSKSNGHYKQFGRLEITSELY